MTTKDSMQNPLLSLQAPIAFDRVQPAHIPQAVDTLIAEADARIAEIAESSEAPTYETTLGALEAATEKLEVCMSVVEHLESVATSEAFREAYNAVLPRVSAFWSGIPLNAGLYTALKRYSQTTGVDSLEPTRRRFLTKTLDDFKRHGAELHPEGKQRLSAIDQELTQLTTKFSQNVLDATNAFELIINDESRLKGLPASAVEAARASAKAKGQAGYRFTLQAPSVISILTYAEDSQLRESIWRAFNTRGIQAKWDNRPLIVQILNLRREKAKLLGYGNFAELQLVDRMAETADQARRFVTDLTERTRKAFERETRELMEFYKQLEGAPSAKLEPWDVAYCAEKQRRARYDFDEQALRPYFPAESVLKGAFETAERLYGVRIEAVTDVPVWDGRVRPFRLLNENENQLALFYVDLYPRENKRDGAWMHDLISAVPPEPHVAVFCMNATPPTDDKPSLFTHSEVETLFHEFGHLLHQCLSRVNVRSLSGTRVARDFVELPSQIMENWCTEKLALDLFARHYETGAPVPAELLQKLIATRTYRAGSAQMRQLGFAALDLALHMDYDEEQHGDVVGFANRILAQYAPTAYPDEYALVASFSHLFSHPVGYAAGYYSYKWAEVLDADAFGRFKKEGIFNPETGREFRQRILEQGDSSEPMALFESFMGRAPRLEPLLERQGLL